MIPTGENRGTGTGTETGHSATVCTTNTTHTGLGSNPDLRGDLLYFQNFYSAHKEPGQ